MKLRLNTVLASIALFAAVTSVPAQARLPFDKPAEPFSISRGSSFDISGSDPANAIMPNGERPSKIAAEFFEAEELIRKRHFDGKKLTYKAMTSSILDGALKTLDPHSDFYDSDEWREFLEEEESTYAGIGATIATYTRNGVDSTYILGTFAGSAAAGAKFKYGACSQKACRYRSQPSVLSPALLVAQRRFRSLVVLWMRLLRDFLPAKLLDN